MNQFVDPVYSVKEPALRFVDSLYSFLFFSILLILVLILVIDYWVWICFVLVIFQGSGDKISLLEAMPVMEARACNPALRA